MADSDLVQAVQQALRGDPSQLYQLDTLSFDPRLAQELSPQLVPLLLKLASETPSAALQIPESAIKSLLAEAKFSEILKIVNFPKIQFTNPALSFVLLSKAINAETNELENDGFIEHALQLFLNEEFEFIGLLEQLVANHPVISAKYLPLNQLHNKSSSAILQARSLALNVILLTRKIEVAPVCLEVLLDDTDFVLAFAQLDYIKNLVDLMDRNPNLRYIISDFLHDLLFNHKLEDIYKNSVNKVLASLAAKDEVMFQELDANFGLVTTENPNLLAMLPPDYLVNKHPTIVSELRLNQHNIYAVVNVMVNQRAWRLLDLNESKLLKLEKSWQLMLAVSATRNELCATEFSKNYKQVLQNAVNMPVTEEYRDLVYELRTNMKTYGIKLEKSPDVATSSY